MRDLPRLTQTINSLNSAQQEGIFSSYAFGVYLDGGLAFGYGGCDEDSLFDLASLTKVLCTTTLFSILEAQSKISQEAKLCDFFPKFKSSKVKLSHLFYHNSGFPAWLPMHEKFHNIQEIKEHSEIKTFCVEQILSSWKKEAFEKEIVYSDLGFLLLGWILEAITKESLDALFQEHITIPLGLEQLQFLPINPNTVPTENCPWRKRILRGEVHDDNCFVLGGVAGHAGLFGNALDVIKLASVWYRAIAKNDNQFLDSSLAKQYWTPIERNQTKHAFGWDCLAAKNSSAGRYFSPETRGHLGFTGTSLWIDPTQDLIVTLLTNRVHPTRENDKIKAFRPLFHDTLLTELGLGRTVF